MARAGVNASETLDCPGVGAGAVVELVVALIGGAEGYTVVNVGPDRLQFARSYRPTWALVAGGILTPVLIGIPILLHRVAEQCTATVLNDHRGTRLQLSGRLEQELHTRLQSALGELVAGRPIPNIVAPPTASPGASARVDRPLGGPAVRFAPNGASPAAVPMSQAAPVAMPTGAPVVLPSGAPLGPPTGAPVVMPTGAPVPPVPSVGPAAAPAAAARSAAPVHSPTSSWFGSAATPAGSAAPAAGGYVSEHTVSRVGGTPAPPAGAPAVPVIVLDDGRRIELAARVHLGREPDVLDLTEPIDLVVVDDVERSVSKTHLALRRNGSSVLVADLGSTNGSAIVSPDGVDRPLAPGEWAELSAGWEVRFGRRSARLTGGRT